jgi:RNA polymerase sigma factor (sigma-70 family)
MTDSLQQMASFAKGLPLLTAAQEAELAGQIKAGRKRAGQKLAEHNIRLVLHIAHRHHYGTDRQKLADLVGEGMTGLMEAVQTFDPEKGRFTTHATNWIRARVLAFLMNTGRIVRVGTTTHDGRKLHWNLRSVRAALESSGQKATPEAIGAALDMNPATVADLMGSMLAVDKSTDAYRDASGESTATVGDYMEGDIPDPESVCVSSSSMDRVKARIARFRENLTEKEQAVLDGRILADRTLQEIGDSFGSTREAMRQIEVRVKSKLRRRLADLYQQICLAPA